MDAFDLLQQNRALNEQVKLLVKTEKRLALVQRENQAQIKRMLVVNEFSLACRQMMNVDAILSKAAVILCDVYAYHLALCYLHQGPKPVFFKQDKVGVRTEVPISSNSKSIFGWLQDLSQPLTTIGSNAEQLEILKELSAIADAPILASAAVPIETQNGARGGIFILRVAHLPASFHQKPPDESDLPFLNLMSQHITASIESAVLHQELLNSKTDLENRVANRTQDLANSLEILRNTQSQLMDTSRKAGMSDVATNILHNVGNVLTSVNTSANLAKKHIIDLPTERLKRLAQVHNLSRDQIEALPQYLFEIAKLVKEQQDQVLSELNLLQTNIDHMKSIISSQQEYAKTGGMIEEFDLSTAIDLALTICIAAAGDIQVKKKYCMADRVRLDRHNLIQILVNILKNAIHAMGESTHKVLDLQTHLDGPDRFAISIKDSGRGIEPQDLSRMFSQGFSKTKGGHGFGLHSCLVAAQKMGGNITVSSSGIQTGAEFVIRLPITQYNADGEYNEPNLSHPNCG